jgi:hypothetical protein
VGSTSAGQPKHHGIVAPRWFGGRGLCHGKHAEVMASVPIATRPREPYDGDRTESASPVQARAAAAAGSAGRSSTA